MSIDQQIGARGPPPAESRQNKIVRPIFQFIGTCRSRQFGIVDSETAAGSEKAEGLGGCEVVSELQVRVIEAILGETAPRNQAFQVSEVTLADVHQPSKFPPVHRVSPSPRTGRGTRCWPKQKRPATLAMT